MADPTYSNGKWTIKKDPDDILFYSADISAQLAASATTATTVETIVQGVTVDVPASIQGGVVTVRLAGLDVTNNAQNFCTFRVTCANGEQFDSTIWFEREDH